MQCALIVHIAIACLLPQSSAVRMLSGWDRPRGEGVRDRQLLSAPLERQEARARGEAAAATQNGTRRPRKHPERDHPGMFRACGVDWLDYEPLHLNSTGDATHYAACAPASGDASTIGICRSDGHGHDSWEYCMDPPAAKCGGLVGSHGPPAKLFFVVCTQVLVRLPDDHDDHDDHDDGIHTAAPTAAPTASPSTAPTAGPVEAPKSAPTVAPTVSPTAAPTATPTAAATPAPSAAPTAPANVASPPLTTLAAEADAGATSLMVVSMAGLSVGDEIVISGGGNDEVVTVAGFAANGVLLTAPMVHGYPADSTVARRTDVVASVRNDPHVTNLHGERFDIREPSPDCTLLRVPYGEDSPELLRLSPWTPTECSRVGSTSRRLP
ncbi:unnamed protein product [Prorocentrum cordatum]|uniref:Uncharacterized protein n=1 Tax=Prorocentrum cordatum TaxID=2364126 RepID=A0ABN9XGW9_9DINO|nr:unnamed protein product [Polarella glacialis]